MRVCVLVYLQYVPKSSLIKFQPYAHIHIQALSLTHTHTLAYARMPAWHPAGDGCNGVLFESIMWEIYGGQYAGPGHSIYHTVPCMFWLFSM